MPFLVCLEITDQIKKNRISEESVPKTFGYIFTTISLGNGKKRCRLQELQTNYFPIAFFPKYNLLQKLKSATLFSVRWQVRINGLNITFDFEKQLCWLEANCFFNQNPCYFQQGIRRNRNKAKFHLVQQKYLSTGRGVGEQFFRKGGREARNTWFSGGTEGRPIVAKNNDRSLEKANFS